MYLRIARSEMSNVSLKVILVKPLIEYTIVDDTERPEAVHLGKLEKYY